MVRAWFMDNDTTTERRLEHHLSPPQYIELDELYKNTNVEYFKVSQALIIYTIEYSVIST